VEAFFHVAVKQNIRDASYRTEHEAVLRLQPYAENGINKQALETGTG